MDEHNIKLAHFAKQLCGGLSNEFVASAFYYVKPLQCAAMPVKMIDNRKYWMRIAVKTGA